MPSFDLEHEIRELQPEGSRRQQHARLLLIRCKLTGDIADKQAERHQSLAMDHLLRLLTRSFAARDLVVRLNESDVLIVLASAGINVAAVLIREAIEEVRTKLLGHTQAWEEFTVAGAAGARPGPALPAAPVTFENPLNLSPLRYSFSPVRDLKNKAITTYYLQSYGDKLGVGQASGYEMLHGGESSPMVSVIDLQVLKRAQRELEPYRGQNIPFVLVWDIHTQTVDNMVEFQRYAKILAAISTFAKDRIVLQINGVRADWPLSRMQVSIGMLRRHVRFVAVRQTLECAIFDDLKACGAANIAVPMPAPQDEPNLLPRLSRFCEGAGRAGLVTVAQTIGTRSIASMSVAAGFRFLHADYLDEQRPRAAAATRFDIGELFALKDD